MNARAECSLICFAQFSGPRKEGSHVPCSFQYSVEADIHYPPLLVCCVTIMVIFLYIVNVVCITALDIIARGSCILASHSTAMNRTQPLPSGQWVTVLHRYSYYSHVILVVAGGGRWWEGGRLHWDWRWIPVPRAWGVGGDQLPLGLGGGRGCVLTVALGYQWPSRGYGQIIFYQPS